MLAVDWMGRTPNAATSGHKWQRQARQRAEGGDKADGTLQGRHHVGVFLIFLISLHVRNYPTITITSHTLPLFLSTHHHLFATERILHAASSIAETLLGALEVAAALLLSIIGAGAGCVAGLLGGGLGVFGLEGAGDLVGGAGDVLGGL